MTKTTSPAPLAAARPACPGAARRDAMFERIVTAGPGPAEGPWPPQRYPRPKRTAVLVGTGLTVVAAAGVGLPMALAGAGHPQPAPEQFRLSSFTFKLPGGYRQGPFATTSCHPGIVVEYPAGTPEAAPLDDQPDEPGIVSAANTSGGCISMALIGPYTPGSSETPTIAGIGGPLAPSHRYSQAIQVGPYQARIGPFKMQGWTDQGVPLAAPWDGETEIVLDVTVPGADGQVSDVVVSSTQLSESALVSLVSQGLTGTAAPSVPASTTPTTTAASAPRRNSLTSRTSTISALSRHRPTASLSQGVAIPFESLCCRCQ